MRLHSTLLEKFVLVKCNIYDNSFSDNLNTVQHDQGNQFRLSYAQSQDVRFRLSRKTISSFFCYLRKTRSSFLFSVQADAISAQFIQYSFIWSSKYHATSGSVSRSFLFRILITSHDMPWDVTWRHCSKGLTDLLDLNETFTLPTSCRTPHDAGAPFWVFLSFSTSVLCW